MMGIYGYLFAAVLPSLASVAACVESAPARTTSSGIVLQVIGGRTVLSKGYSLGVVEIAPPPVFVHTGVATGEGGVEAKSGCPLEVRGLLTAQGSDSMAIVSVNDESTVVRVGDSLRVGPRRVRITRLASDYVVVRSGSSYERCYLTTGTTANLPRKPR
ncbi:MAG: hypothetical protein R3C68_19615 [Myxococcota bacterium]